jgi:hypothetical protein
MSLEQLINKLKEKNKEYCYPKRIDYLKNLGRDTSIIQEGIADTIKALHDGARSFVVYGEPQSGKTEFMIALVCKLIDEGYKTIFIIMNDNTELENQNFDRFHSAKELNPTPIRDSQVPHLQEQELKTDKQRIIFCRKNSKNLEKLTTLTRFMKNRVIIDDEADYATPNSKINKDELTKINERVLSLGHLGSEQTGIYIGVTATPARLDLNNTFDNDTSRWVFLKSHEKYKGRSFFFPVTNEDKERSDYKLVKLPDDKDDPKLLRHAVMRFMIRVAMLHSSEGASEDAYSMLVHTAGSTEGHIQDQKEIQKILNILSNENSPQYMRWVEELLGLAENLVSEYLFDFSAVKLSHYVLSNIGRSEVLVINHKNDSQNVKRAGQPKAMFTFAIGGNIVSRGLTFERLLTFFFSRNVKNKLQQNTYIQRARMFGHRPYSKYFELCVPNSLFHDWADCFQDHELSLRMAKANYPIHIYGGRTQVTDRASIDLRNVTVENSERPVGDITDLTDELYSALLNIDLKNPLLYLEKLIDKGILPKYAIAEVTINYLKEVIKKPTDVSIVLVKKKGTLDIQDISNYKDGDQESISRARGGVIHGILNKRPEYEKHDHFILPMKNTNGKIRFYYKPRIGKTILQNLKVD